MSRADLDRADRHLAGDADTVRRRGAPSDLRAADRRRIPGTDLDVAALGLGGNVFGFTCDVAASHGVLDAYVEWGGNMIDTADSYCSFLGTEGGESETIIGDWMASRANRDQLIVATKVGQAPGRESLRRDTIRLAVEGSLRRLRTDRIDLYYAHQDHGEPLEETVAAFDELVQEGKVRHLGASNFAADRLDEVLEIAHDSGATPFVALQPEYNLMRRATFEERLRPICELRHLGVLPYWGLACGYLTGKYRLGADPADSPRAAYVQEFVNERGEGVLAALESAAIRRGVSLGAVALAWLSSRPGIVAPLASARTPAQLAELVSMASIQLDGDELRALDAASAESLVP